MCLHITPELVEKAQRDEVVPDDVISLIAESFPAFHSVIMTMITEMEQSSDVYIESLDWIEDESIRQQFHEGGFSDAYRDAMRESYGVEIAFRHCCAPSLVKLGHESDPRWQEFRSGKALILDQLHAVC